MSKQVKKKFGAWAILAGAVVLAWGVSPARADVFDSNVQERSLGEMRLRDHRGSQLECAALDAKSSLDSAEVIERSNVRTATRSAASAAE